MFESRRTGSGAALRQCMPMPEIRPMGARRRGLVDLLRADPSNRPHCQPDRMERAVPCRQLGSCKPSAPNCPIRYYLHCAVSGRTAVYHSGTFPLLQAPPAHTYPTMAPCSHNSWLAVEGAGRAKEGKVIRKAQISSTRYIDEDTYLVFLRPCLATPKSSHCNPCYSRPSGLGRTSYKVC